MENGKIFLHFLETDAWQVELDTPDTTCYAPLYRRGAYGKLENDCYVLQSFLDAFEGHYLVKRESLREKSRA